MRPADEISSLEIALAENVAREDLNAIEEALAYAALVDEFGLTHERIAELVGRSRVAVTNLLRLLDLPDDVQAMLERGDLTEGHGRALLALPDHGERRRVARLVVTEGLTVRQVEALVRKLNEEGPEGAAPAARPAAGRGLHRAGRRALRGVRGAGADPQRQARRLHPDRLQGRRRAAAPRRAAALARLTRGSRLSARRCPA